MVFRRMRSVALLGLLLALHATFLTIAPVAYAQKAQPAAQQQDLVARGRALFDDQQYEESVQTLSAALLRPNNTKAQRVEIYRLLALNYITLNHKDEAESAVRGLLALQPDYALPASESPRFRDFFADVKKRWEGEGRPGLVKESEAPPVPVTMQHVSPSQVDKHTQVDLTAKLVDPQNRVTSVKLFFRAGSKGKFDEVEADVTSGDVKASIPPDSVKPPIVEYYLIGLDKGGLPIVSRGDATAPLRIAVPGGTGAWVLPVAIGGGVLVAAAGIVAGVLLFGKSSGSGPPGKGPGSGMNSTSVSVSIGQ
jgi:tetratricopeptide (TPR) repeat protein